MKENKSCVNIGKKEDHEDISNKGKESLKLLIAMMMMMLNFLYK
jgi:hypothetical protein